MVDTPFKLISMLIKVFSAGCEHAEQASSRGVLEGGGGGGGGGGATGLLNRGGGEQQASWFSKETTSCEISTGTDY